MKFPQKLYVKCDKDGDNVYYVASTDWTELADKDESFIEAAVYELTEVGKLAVKT